MEDTDGDSIPHSLNNLSFIIRIIKDQISIFILTNKKTQSQISCMCTHTWLILILISSPSLHLNYTNTTQMSHKFSHISQWTLKNCLLSNLTHVDLNHDNAYRNRINYYQKVCKTKMEIRKHHTSWNVDKKKRIKHMTAFYIAYLYWSYWDLLLWHTSLTVPSCKSSFTSLAFIILQHNRSKSPWMGPALINIFVWTIDEMTMHNVKEVDHSDELRKLSSDFTVPLSSRSVWASFRALFWLSVSQIRYHHWFSSHSS